MKEKTKVLLFTLETIKNVGDEMLRTTTEYLISSIKDDYCVEILQLKPKIHQIPFLHRFFFLCGVLLNRISNYLSGTFKHKTIYLSYIIKYYLLFRGKINQTDKIILPLGMLKYGTQDISCIFSMIVRLANQYHKPVLVSATSPQMPENTKDWRYEQLMKDANLDCIQSITTRDGVEGLATLRDYYVKKDSIKTDFVGDPALWIPECYGFPNQKRSRNNDDIPYVGINVIRTDIFDDYNKGLTSELLFSFYIELVNKVKEKDWNWCLFTNGMDRDNEVVEKLRGRLHLQDENILKFPANGAEYVSMLSKFDMVFGSRLHSCITSVALGIPVVGFVWDDKIRLFAKSMKIEDRFFYPKDLSASSAIIKLENVLNEVFDFENRDYYKNKTKSSIMKFLE